MAVALSLSCVQLLRPHGLWSARLLCPWNSLGKILEWVVFPFSRGSSWLRDQTLIACISGRFFTVWGICEAQLSRWPLAINSVMSSLSPLPRGGDIGARGELRGDWKCQPSNKWLILLAVSPHSQGIQEHLRNHLINITKDTFIALVTGNYNS